MDNYLSYRWPAGPPKAPLRQQKPVKRRRRGHLLRNLLALAGSLALIALLITGSYFGIILLADHISAEQPVESFPSVRPSHTAKVTDWQPEDLPWGSADPDAQITLSAAHEALTGSEIYQMVLPSIVGITASSNSGYGMGSGIIATEDGYIVTNYHVIEESTAIQVILLSNESSYDAVVIGYDEAKDIAVLKIDAQGLTPASFGSSDDLLVGDPAYAIGNPMGYLYGTITDGVVSALARPQEIDGNSMYLIQTSAALNSGNSGGALVNQYGQVVGITVAKISDSDAEVTIEGLGLAIPISDALPFLNHILHTGQSWRPAIGIMCYEVDADGVRGIMVQEVTAGTPAVGVLQPQDVILSANGVDTPKLYNLSRVLGEANVGDTLELTVLRGGEMVTVAVTLYDSLDQ